MNSKKIIFLIIVFIWLALPFGYASAQLPNLEIIYPRIPGEGTPPKVISEGLPNYVNYIYYFSFAVIGVIVLGALIYNGIIYLTSVGNPEKLMSAKKGITGAFLGAIILFSSWFVFRNINPEITILEAENPNLIEPVIPPGIYLCNYNADSEPSIGSILARYKNENATEEEKIATARDFKAKIKNGNNICFRVAFSGNISFEFFKTYSIFSVPRKDYVSVPVTEENPEGVAIEWKNDYGIIFHEKDNFKGRCEIEQVYDQKYNYDQKIYPWFGVRSVTLFKWPGDVPNSNITLYQCLDYNQTGLCPDGLTGKPGLGTFPEITTNNILIWTQQSALSSQNLDAPSKGRLTEEDNINGTRSIKINQEGSYFAVLFSEDNFKGEICEVIAESDNNLLDQPIGQCHVGYYGTRVGNECNGLFDWNSKEEYLRDCRPCTNSLVVIKGSVIK